MLAEKKAHESFETPPGRLVPHYARLQQEELPVRLQNGKAVAPIARQRLALAGHEHSEDRDHHLVAGERHHPEPRLAELTQERGKRFQETADGTEMARQFDPLAGPSQ